MRGFTLVELVVVVALVALLSAVVLFDGGGSRDRHTVEGAYDVLDVSLSQAILLSRSQPNDSDAQSATHWVLDSANNTVMIYQDAPLGTGGEYDVSDTLRETYELSPEVAIVTCDGARTTCVQASELLVMSWIPGSPEATVREGSDVLTALYLDLAVKEKSISLSINKLGLMQKEL